MSTGGGCAGCIGISFEHSAERIQQKDGGHRRSLGFKTVEVGGICYGDLATVSALFGYAQPLGLSKLLKTYDILTPKMGQYIPEVKVKIRAKLDISPKNSQARLIDWKGVLVFGLHSQMPTANSLKLHLFAMELAGSEAMDSRAELEQQRFALQKARTIGYLMERYEKANDGISKEILKEQIESITGKNLPAPRQGGLKLVQQKPEEE